MKITPDYLPNPCTPLGYTGSELCGLFVDKQAVGDFSLRVSLIPDRALIQQMSYYNDNLTSHAWATRESYTIPSGKRGLLESIFFELEQPTAGALLKIKCAFLGRPLAQLTVENATPARDRLWSQTMNVWLTAGDILSIDTYSGDASSREFYGAMLLSVFDG